MNLFRAKPAIVKAYQFDINKYDADIEKYPEEEIDNCEYCNEPMKNHGYMFNSIYEQCVCPGDWIITEESGDKYPLNSSEFELRYEQVQDKAITI